MTSRRSLVASMQHANAVAADVLVPMPVGTPVWLTLDNGSTVETFTRSRPWYLPSGTWVILVEGRTGGWDCSRVRPRT